MGCNVDGSACTPRRAGLGTGSKQKACCSRALNVADPSSVQHQGVATEAGTLAGWGPQIDPVVEDVIELCVEGAGSQGLSAAPCCNACNGHLEPPIGQ